MGSRELPARLLAARCRFPGLARALPDRGRCVLGGEGPPFVEGEAQLADIGLPLLNRLAAIAVRCLNSSSLRLEVAGHTNSVGNDARNKALSQARADADTAGAARPWRPRRAVTAIGYGESRPVATNNTPEGREQNRRIVLEWSGSDS